ncbi:hypothetical protein [Frateuria aurantia]|uniref:Uncharacterized protein n=1 Tax=Frateuria aurantia (strain ATCC 33424 / DSM 6220 / KCTC 2777 / LMG 1558 / NBRC 3245 / NCIMB 13370) TaxID=767434 RepID=H8L2H0_FRAAD|nr:hypothetical protein [Frateuria aurantia]AFC85437.1 hypothetical protein Fraau_0973 [Frateuria aurantia DSM 6220]
MNRLILSDSAAVIALAIYLGIPFELIPRALRNLLLMAWGAFVLLQIAGRSVSTFSLFMKRRPSDCTPEAK